MSKLMKPRSFDINPFFGDRFEDLFNVAKNTIWAGVFSPPCDITLSEDHALISMDIPGINPDSVKITTENRNIIVQGERTNTVSATDKFLRSERIYGKFSRSWTVPDSFDLDKISATYESGVLNIRIELNNKAEKKQVEVKILKA